MSFLKLSTRKKTGVVVGATALFAVAVSADQQFLDDTITVGSHCVGQDCVNGETFSFDTLRLKENNLRIHFQDTSTSASFPTNDWRLIANDSNNGGDNHFSIEDATAGRVPFSVRAGAPNNALYIDDTGVGLGTTPARAFHMATADTPTLRLEQTEAAGWPARRWDVGSNETNFFVRDVDGLHTPLRVAPQSETASAALTIDGVMGVGTETPAAALHVVDADGASVVLEDTSAATMWTQTVGADPDVVDGTMWTLQADDNAVAMRVTHDGNLELAGMVLNTSSRSAKSGFTSVDSDDVLDRVDALPVSRWRYTRDASGAEHISPMAEDFHAAFGLGPDARHLAPQDLAGVAVVSVQALHDKVKTQKAEIAQLKEESAALQARLQKLEELLRDQ